MVLDFGQRAVKQISLPIDSSANFSPAATLSDDGSAAFTYSYGLGIVMHSAAERSSDSLTFGDSIVLLPEESVERRFAGWIHEESYSVIVGAGESNKVFFNVGDATKPTVGRYDGSLTLMMDINMPGVASVVGPGEPIVVLEDGGVALATRTLGTGTWKVDLVRNGKKLSLGSFAEVGRGGHDLYVLQSDRDHYKLLKLTSDGFVKISEFFGHVREGGIRPFVVIAARVPGGHTLR